MPQQYSGFFLGPIWHRWCIPLFSPSFLWSGDYLSGIYSFEKCLLVACDPSRFGKLAVIVDSLSRLWTAHWMVMHSSSIDAYLVCFGIRDAQPHWIRDHYSFGNGCTIAKPVLYSRNASVIKMVNRFGLKVWTVVVVVSGNLNFPRSRSMTDV